MTLARLVGVSLRFHWRGSLAVLLGVAVGTAVLTGALVIGDSLRGSLRQRALDQLGWVDQALIGSRLFRAQLVEGLPAERTAAVLLLQGTIQVEKARAGRVMIAGVDAAFWDQEQKEFWNSDQAEAVLSPALAAELEAGAGSRITLQVQRASAVPRETVLGRRSGSDVVLSAEVTVREVLPADSFAAQFSLSPSPLAARNVYVPLRFLQEQLKQPGRANVILARGANGSLNEALKPTLEDWGLVLRDPDNRTRALLAKLDRNQDERLSKAEWRGRLAEAVVRGMDADQDGAITKSEARAWFDRQGYLSLESTQMLLEPAVEQAALQAARELNLRAAPTLVYLANWIRAGEQRIPYSVVAALDPASPPPLGPFLPPGADKLADDEIILAGWDKSPLTARLGDEIELTYFEPVEQGRLEERTARFRLKGVTPLAGLAADPDLTPEFPGITDKLTIADWDPPFPYDNKRIKPADEDYWSDYRTTPKAYVTLTAGRKLWASRFGQLTSIRLSNVDPEPAIVMQNAAAYRKKLLQHLDPRKGGFVFQDLRGRALAASVGGTDFGFLFLGFSFFLIAAALLLVGLLVRLNLDRRAAELGLLLAAGYRAGTVRRLLLTEGAILTAWGGLLGIAAAVVYAGWLLDYLNASWPGGLDRSFLRLHVQPLSLLIGWLAGLLVSVLTIQIAVRVLRRVPPRALLAGDSIDPASGQPRPAGRIPRWIVMLALPLALGSIAVGTQLQLPDLKAMSFFLGGALLLAAALAGIWLWLRQAPAGRPHASVGSLGARNAGRQPVRSLLTAGLLAAAAFLIVAVESFRRQPERNFLDKHAGSGGFVLVGESDVPVYEDLNQGAGRQELLDGLERAYRQQPTAAPAAERMERARQVLQEATIYPLRLKGGDDASCLNLYQASRPRLLGVPPAMIERGGFLFVGTLAQSAEEKANPWRLLEAAADGTASRPIPVFAEQNSVLWMLKSGLGGVLTIPRDGGAPIHVRIVGILQDNPFQSELWLSEANFLRLFPGHEGYNVYLIETKGSAGEAAALLETGLASRGFDVTPSAERVAAYQAVVNTYLSTFQALGGLGLLLGALGLAVVLLRNVWERRGELALLRALGFRRRTLGWLVLAENACLLLLGLGAGTLAALIAVAPHAAAGGQVPWLRLTLLLLLVLVVGLGAGLAALLATLRAPLIPALRRE